VVSSSKPGGFDERGEGEGVMTDRTVAVVTGGSRGIGSAIVRRLALLGHVVLILDLEPPEAEVLNESFDSGGAVLFQECDVTDLEAVRMAADSVASRGSIEVLVNNAGWSMNQRFLESEPAAWRRMIDINYTAVLNTCHVFGSRLVDGGAIVNVASDAARIGVPGQAVYAGAKAAVIGFSKSLAVELARRGIRINVVCPGTTLTPLLQAEFSEEDIAKRVRLIPLRRLADPDDLAKTVEFLATQATHVTGQVLSVNGGAARVG
jgi:2-hydroxycyclohexanecarboxyl-CoA dehydrogenase